MDVRFRWIGQTGGAAFWAEKDREKNQCGAASLYLNGLEGMAEQQEFFAALAAYHVPMPFEKWAEIERRRKPLLVLIYRDLYYYTSPVLATAAPALGAAFFGLFGTAESIDGPVPPPAS